MPINVQRTSEGTVEIWSDTDADRLDGRCIGVGPTLEEAKRDAIRELADDLRAVADLTDDPPART
jgi:hypothetical protein